MPNTKSAIKRTKSSAKKNINNTNLKSALKTVIKKCRHEIAAKTEAAQDSFKLTGKILDQAAAKGIIHKNTAARRKSRLAKSINV